MRRKWKCPKCGDMLKKLDSYTVIGDSIYRDMWHVRHHQFQCPNCGTLVFIDEDLETGKLVSNFPIEKMRV